MSELIVAAPGASPDPHGYEMHLHNVGSEYLIYLVEIAAQISKRLLGIPAMI